jgi:predicted nucleotide-binding protein (sugar kinase/HSP70/actin superfamily)
MKISFPYMGEATIAYKKLAAGLGHELVNPLKPTQRTIDLGVKYAPEFACFPLKVLMGTYLEEAERGVETIVSSGGHGPCRAGYYGEVHKKILDNLGYNIRLIILDSIRDNPRRFISDMKHIKGKASLSRLWYMLKLTYNAIKLLDASEQRLNRIRPYECKNGAANKAWKEILNSIDATESHEDLEKCRQYIEEILNGIAINAVEDERRIRIGIIGEIYVVLESAANMEMEQTLCSLGCEVRRSQYLSDWIQFNMIPHFISHPHEAEVRRMGREFFPIPIGGHAQENMGWINQFHQWGYDGIVHLLPFGCLPELMSQSLIPAISRKYNMPIISFALDEQSGLANNRTRLEAFVDLVRAQKFPQTRNKKAVV